MNDEDDDVLLTGMVDGELDEGRRNALLARLANEAPLRERLEAIKAGGRPFRAAFDALLEEAPLERLKASLASLGPAAAPRPAFWSMPRSLAAGVAVAVFLAGFGLGRFAPHPAPEVQVAEPVGEDWRDAVAEYAALYTHETFANAPADDSARGAELKTLGAKLGIDLSPERTRIDNLAFKTATLLAYDGAPLGQLAYSDAQAAPVLFCIIADSRPDAPLVNEARGNFALTTWAHEGRGYMVIAHLPADRIAEIAGQLSQRF